MVYLDPAQIITDFLRDKLMDPRDRAEDLNSDSFTATASQTDFTLTPTSGTSVSVITAVTVNGTSKKKWRDYYPIFETEKLVFFSGLTVGDAVVVTYKEGSTNWIFDDKPNENINAISFPRISVGMVAGSGQRLGQFNAKVETGIQFQASVWAKEKQSNQIFTINGQTFTGEKLAKYLSFLITEAIEDSESDLHPALYSYVLLQLPRAMPFDVTYQAHHRITEFMLNGLDIGRVS